MAGVINDDEDPIEYDDNGNPIVVKNKVFLFSRENQLFKS